MLLAAPGEGTRQQGPPAPSMCSFSGSELLLEREKPTRGVSQRKRETKNSSPREQAPFALLRPLASALTLVSDWAK